MRIETGVKTTVGVALIERRQAIIGILLHITDLFRFHSLKPIIVDGVQKQRWLLELHVRSIDTDMRIWRELVIKIDWEKHDLYLTQGEHEVKIPANHGLVYGMSSVLGDALQIHREYTTRHDLQLDWAVVGNGSDHHLVSLPLA